MPRAEDDGAEGTKPERCWLMPWVERGGGEEEELQVTVEEETDLACWPSIEEYMIGGGKRLELCWLMEPLWEKFEDGVV